MGQRRVWLPANLAWFVGHLFRWSFEQRTPEPGPASANMAPLSVSITSVQGLYGAVWRTKRIFVLQQAFYDSIFSLYGS